MGKINLTPTEGYILIETIQKDTSDLSKVVIGGDQKEPKKGKVIATGKNTFYPNTDRVYVCPVEVGDTIIHSGYGLEPLTIDSKEAYLCPFDKILAIYGDA